MFIKLSNKIKKDIVDITNCSYEMKENDLDTMYIEDVIEDLIYQYHILEEKYNDLQEDVKDNYKRIDVAEQVGISDKDFI